MKKQAYTLAEALITIGVIGIIAAIVAPAVNNLRPDPDKAMYLKAYNALLKSVHNIAKDTSIYAPIYTYDNEQLNVSHFPLINDNKPTNPAFSSYSGATKLDGILADVLGNKTISTSPVKFTTSDGMIWEFSDKGGKLKDTSNGFVWSKTLKVDINGDEGPNTLYTANMKGHPDQYQFVITASGNVEPMDVYGQMYLDNRKNWLRRKDDAETLANGIQKGKYGEIKIGSDGNVEDEYTKIPYAELGSKKGGDVGSGNDSGGDVTPGDNSGGGDTPGDNSGSGVTSGNNTGSGVTSGNNTGGDVTPGNNSGPKNPYEHPYGDGRTYNTGTNIDDCRRIYQGIWDGYGCIYD